MCNSSSYSFSSRKCQFSGLANAINGCILLYRDVFRPLIANYVNLSFKLNPIIVHFGTNRWYALTSCAYKFVPQTYLQILTMYLPIRWVLLLLLLYFTSRLSTIAVLRRKRRRRPNKKHTAYKPNSSMQEPSLKIIYGMHRLTNAHTRTLLLLLLLFRCSATAAMRFGEYDKNLALENDH